MRSVNSDRIYMVIDAVLTDNENIGSYVRMNWSSIDKGPHFVAEVCLDDGQNRYYYQRVDDTYRLDIRNLDIRPGKTYHLKIKTRTKDRREEEYHAWSVMKESGFRLDSIRCKYDSLRFNFFLWGQDKGIENSTYMFLWSLNQHVPHITSVPWLSNMLFLGKYVSGYQMPLRNSTYRDLKQGDTLSMHICTMTDESKEFYASMDQNTSSTAIPLISPPSANVPTNFSGNNVLGFFSVFSTTTAKIIVE